MDDTLGSHVGGNLLVEFDEGRAELGIRGGGLLRGKNLLVEILDLIGVVVDRVDLAAETRERQVLLDSRDTMGRTQLIRDNACIHSILGRGVLLRMVFVARLDGFGDSRF